MGDVLAKQLSPNMLAVYSHTFLKKVSGATLRLALRKTGLLHKACSDAPDKDLKPGT